MRKKITSVCISLMMVLASGIPALAGGALEQVDITGNVPSPIPGQLVAKLVPIRWDTRTLPVQYRVNNTLNPIPNALGAPFLSVADATTVLQRSLDRWNNIPTSYINMQIVGTVANAGVRGFDMKNEITFRTAASFTAIASSPSTSLIADTDLVNGDDIDGDGDSDVSSAITTAQDVDSDGDIEFPAGFYKAGTILDNDVQFNTKASNGFRFTTLDAQLDTNTRSVDLECTAVHEFGHSFGLSHTLDNQYSLSDPNGTTMFPFIDTGDPASELSQRTPESDDIAWASYFYPEGTATSGPAALQAGDIGFSKVYGLIKGSVRHGVLDQPIAGASLSAVNWDTGAFVASGFSGTTQVSYNPATGGLFLIDPAFNILDGNYVIPVPKGSYAVGVEAMDGNPVAAANVSLTGQIGSIFGQLDFNEEFWNNNLESGRELLIGQRKNVPVQAGKTQTGINIVTGLARNINNFGNRNFIGFTGQAGGSYYAVRIPASQITDAIAALNPGGDILIQAAAFDTNILDASTPAFFAKAVLATGSGSASSSTATVNLATPLQIATGFLGQDNDFAPFYFEAPQDLGRAVRAGIANGTIENLFIVLQLPASPFPGVSAAPPLIGLDGGVAVNDVPIFGLSYTSTDGGATWNKVTNFNFRFSLIVSKPVIPQGQQ